MPKGQNIVARSYLLSSCQCDEEMFLWFPPWSLSPWQKKETLLFGTILCGLWALTHTRKQRWPSKDTQFICKNGKERQVHKLCTCKKLYLNLDSLEEWKQILFLNFEEKNRIKNNNLDGFFHENDKIHKMKRRLVEKYNVQHAKAER